MTKYELPDEPEVGSWVKDADGDLWENTGGGWFCRTDETISYRWSELLFQYGPLESYEPALEPKDGDIRFDKTDKTAFIVRKNNKWIRYSFTESECYGKSWVVPDSSANKYYHSL